MSFAAAAAFICTLITVWHGDDTSGVRKVSRSGLPRFRRDAVDQSYGRFVANRALSDGHDLGQHCLQQVQSSNGANPHVQIEGVGFSVIVGAFFRSLHLRQ